MAVSREWDQSKFKHWVLTENQPLFFLDSSIPPVAASYWLDSRFPRLLILTVFVRVFAAFTKGQTFSFFTAPFFF